MKKALIIITLSLFTLTACQSDYDNGYKAGYEEARSDYKDSGYEEGYEEGYEDGYDEGFDEGYSKCEDETDSQYNSGYVAGYTAIVKFYEQQLGNGQYDPSLIPMLPVQSSFINSVGYSPRFHVLVIKMNGKDVYSYYKVQEYVFYSLLYAESPGTYFNEYIKDKYE